MLKNRKWLGTLRGCTIAALLCAPAVSLSGSLPASTGLPVAASTAQGLGALLAPQLTPADIAVRDAATRFVDAMSAEDAGAVWMFASEEDQDAFATEPALYAAFAETFPVLTDVSGVAVDRSWHEGDTTFVEARLAASGGETYRATFGFWLSDAGDWQLVSCDVKPVSDQLAGL